MSALKRTSAEARRVDEIRGVLGNVSCSSSPTSSTSPSSSSNTMTKPTLVQSILGRPSQSYRFPAAKDYYSTKNDLLRAAVEASSAADSRPQSYFTAADSESGYFSSTTSSSSRYSEARTHSEASSRRSSRLEEDSEAGSGTSRQASSPRPKSQGTLLTQSTASSHSNTDDRFDANFITSSPYTPPTSFSSNTTPRQSPLPSLANQSSYVSETKSASISSGAARDIDIEEDSDQEGTSDSEGDVFYTPRSSLYGSPRTSRTSAGMIIDPKALVSALLPLPSLSKSRSPRSSQSSPDALTPTDDRNASPISRTSSESSLLSSSSSSSTGGTIASSHATTTTQMTSIMTSSQGSSKGEVKTITIARSHHTRSSTTPSFIPQRTSRGQPRPLSATRKRSQTEIRRQTYTDEDWAKDVRWLAPAIAAKHDSPRKHSQMLPSKGKSPISAALPPPPPPPPASPSKLPLPGKSYPPLSPSAEHRKRHSRRSRGSRSSRGRMSALLEEDESEYSDITPGGSSAEPSRSPSPLLEEEAEIVHVVSTSTPVRTVSRSQSRRSAKESSSDEASENPDARVQAYARSIGQPRKTYSHTRRLSRSISPSSFSYSQTLPTHAIPPPTLEPSAPTKSGLTLPHAAPTGEPKATSGDGKIDLVRAGIAQTSMATVEVTRGVAQQGPTPAQKKKRRTFSFQLLPFKKPKGKGKESMTPAHLLDTLPVPVAYLQHLPPPSYVPASHVLLQVFAVGLDPLDSLLVQEKTVNGAKGAGFIPGRSVVGKVIEVGWDVKADVCRRGEWAIGLLDPKKSGAMSEFIVIERHRIHRAPQPLSRPGTLFPSTKRSHVRSKSLPSQFNRHPFAQLHQDLLAPMSLSIEELALLPICGVPAFRAIRTFADVISPAKPKPDAADSTKRARILVLQGHDGPGALAVQMLSHRGVMVWVQVPDSVAREDASSGDEDDTEGAGPSAPSSVRQTRFDRLEARLRAWGAEAICVGEPMEVLERLAQDGRSFDGILDTVGGTDIWEVSRKVLLVDPEQDTSLQDPEAALSAPSTAPSGSPSKPTRASSSANKRTFALTQFTTLVGDTPSRPIPSAQDHLRSGFRSLKRTMSSGSRSRSSSPTKSASGSLKSPSKDSLGPLLRRGTSTRVKTQKRTVSYAWVSVAADLDFEGGDVRDSLGALVALVEEGAVRPWVGDEHDDGGHRVVPFDKAPEVFRRDGEGPVGPLRDGGTCVVRVVP